MDARERKETFRRRLSDEQKAKVRESDKKRKRKKRSRETVEEKKERQRKDAEQRQKARKTRKKEDTCPDLVAVIKAFLELRQLSKENDQLEEELARHRNVTMRALVVSMVWYREREDPQQQPKTSYSTLSRKLQRALAEVRASRGFNEFYEDMSTYDAMRRDFPDGNKVEQYVAIVKRNRVARAIRKACRKELPLACKQLRIQMQTTSVHHPSWVKLEKHKVHRTMCRISYHRAKKSTIGAVPLYTIFPGLYREFFMILEEPTAEETNREREAAVRLTMESLLMVVEELLLRGEAESEEQRAEQPSQDAPDAENIGIEEMGNEEADEQEDMAGEVPEEDEELLREEAEHIILQDPVLGEAAGPHRTLIIPRVILVEPCNCRNKMSPEDACTLKAALLDVLHHVEKGDYRRLLQFEKTALPELRTSAICYTGLRSILSRLNIIRALVKKLRIVKNSFGNSKSEFADFAAANNWKWLPKSIRTIVEATFADDENSKKMRESEVQAKYGRHLERVAEMVADIERYFCDVCNCATKYAEVTWKTKFQMAQFMREEALAERESDPQHKVQICKKCMREARSGKGSLVQRQANPRMPHYSRNNEVDFDPVPKELKKLNWIEKALVQLYRPIRQMVCLNDAGGRKTSMLGVGGAMVMLPVPTEGTLTHVAETLPSDAHLTILVSPEAAKCKLVRLPVVLRALKWLKENNSHYVNITINPAFRFSRESVTFERRPRNAGPVSDADLDELVTNDEDSPSILRHEDISARILRPMDADPPSGIAAERYALLRNPYEPVSVDTTNLDCKAFPWHFPTGRFGVDSPGRRMRQYLKDMVKWWLGNKDRRCARDPQFLSFAHGLLEQKAMTSALGIAARLGRQQMQGDAFLDAINEGSAAFEGAFSSSAKVMRGHVGYWDARKKELRAHVAIFGPPTFFLTLNPAEKRWEEVEELYQLVYGEDRVTKDNIYQFITQDPYWFARIFQQRVRAIFHKLLMFKGAGGGPLGRIIHFYWRIEYQHRGTQHAHCVLWVDGAPGHDATDDERLAFIDKHITARMPDEKTEPELHAIVKGDQMHYETHSLTCKRPYNIKGKKHERCRFDFPRPVTSKSIVNKAAEELQSMPGSRIKMYYVKRRPCDKMVNDYNPAILLAWKGNMDLQYVWGGIGQVVTYVTGYVTKNEKSKDVLDANAVLKETTNSKDAFKALVDLMRMRHCGLLEVIDTINGHTLCEFDSDHIYVNTNASDRRDRMLRPKEVIENEVRCGNKKATAFMENAADNYYPGRAAALENFCYLNIVTRFGFEEQSGAADCDEAMEEEAHEDEAGEADGAPMSNDLFARHFNVHSEHSPMYDHRRTPGHFHRISGIRMKKAHTLLGRPKVPRFFWPNFEEANEESREDYYRRLCMLFVPWRKEEELMGDAESFEARWKHFAEQLAADHPEAFDDIKKIIQHQEALLTVDKEVTEKRKKAQEVRDALRVDDDPEADGPEVFDRDVDEATHAEKLKLMKDGQRKIFDEVIRQVKAQDEYRRAINELPVDLSPVQRHEAIAKLGPKPSSLLRVVVGTAGCGKSFLINMIADALTLAYTTPEKRASEPAVILGAPTGLAAVQIRGSTLHSMLGIEVQHGHEPPLRPLKPLRLNGLRIQFRNVRVLIVDEISMISNIMLMKVHMRLQEIAGNTDELFGGYNVIMLGDLMQLPPVGSRAIFELIDPSKINRIFGAMPMLSNCCLFDQFVYEELTENVRQADDEQFGDALQRLRVQALTDSDIKLLRTRIIERERGEKPMDAAARKLVELMADGSATPMALFATNAEVRDFNQLVVGLLQLNSCVVVAEDSFKRKEFADSAGGGARSRRGDKAKRRIYQEADYDIGRRPGSRRSAKKKRPENGEDGEDARNEDDTNKAAGLEKYLLLAENGRVMLRRNLHPASGLVNGACGVLKEIIKSSDGEAIGLRVLFDDQRERLLEKVSATFDISDDQQQTRRQFPVTMAFGATVHKAQGMTLSGVIVSTKHFFARAPAQGFVALSRVRTLDTLYLVDLHPEKLICCRRALQKYNELRASIGLPQFDDPIKRRRAAAEQEDAPTADGGVPPATPAGRPTPRRRNTTSSARVRIPVRTPTAEGETPTTTRPKKKRGKKAAEDDVSDDDMNDEEFFPSPIKRAKAAPKEKQRAGLEDVQIDPALTLRNYGYADCFIIAACNLIHTMAPLRDAIIAVEPILEAAGLLGPSAPRMRELAAVLRDERTDVVRLRAAGGYADGVGDTRDVFYNLMQDFGEIYDEYCLTHLTTTLKCPNDHEQTDVEPKQYKYLLEAQKLAAECTSGTIDELFKKNLLADARCGECGTAMNQADVNVRLDGRYLIVEINRTAFENGRRQDRALSITGCNAKGMRVFGHTVKMVACMQHLRWDNGDSGHYVVWRRSASGWSVVDDDRAPFPQRQLPNKLSNIHIIIFEKA